jgi:hypothetical protein
MAGDEFSQNLLRVLVAEMHFSNCVAVAREMFGRSYFSLGASEKAAVDQVVLAGVGGNYSAITREWLAGQQTQQPVGFGVVHEEHKKS